MLDCSELTWTQMSEIVHSIWVEMKNRGIMSFTPLFTRLPHFLLDIRAGINYLKYMEGIMTFCLGNLTSEQHEQLREDEQTAGHAFTPKADRPTICATCGGLEIQRDHGFDMKHALITRAIANGGLVALDADGNKLGFPGVANDEKGHRFAAQAFCAHMHWNLNVRRGLIAADGWSWVVPA